MKPTLSIIITAFIACLFIGIAWAEEAIQVPFKLERNKVIVPTSVNGSEPLDIILDTGMGFDGVYLFHKELTEKIDTTGAIEVRVPGAGSGEASTAVMIENGRLSFGEVTVDSQRVIISNSPYTQKFPTDGAIGWNLFGHYITEIDYDNLMITLHDTLGFEPDSSWTRLPFDRKGNLSFFECEAEVNPGEKTNLTIYIDLASSDALELLLKPDQKFKAPDKPRDEYLGTGLSGDIHGFTGTIAGLTLAGYELADIPTKFAPAKVRSKQSGADGVLGNGLVQRFNIVFDYPDSVLYIKPSRYFDQPFE